MRNTVVLASLCLAVLPMASAYAQDVKLSSNVPYIADNEISDAIKAECSLGTQLATSIKQHGPSVVLVDNVPDTASGRVNRPATSAAPAPASTAIATTVANKGNGTPMRANRPTVWSGPVSFSHPKMRNSSISSTRESRRRPSLPRSAFSNDFMVVSLGTRMERPAASSAAGASCLQFGKTRRAVTARLATKGTKASLPLLATDAGRPPQRIAPAISPARETP